MKKLLVMTLLALPAAAAAQELNSADLDAPAAPAQASAEAADTLKRPDAAAIMADLSSALRLSSKQEERISAAISKKSKEFDRLMKDYEKNSAEEKKWRVRTSENRYGMLKINREMPDLVREFLDDEQRQTYDGILEARRKPAPAPAAPAAVEPAAGTQPAKGKLVKKRKLVRRKKVKGNRPGAAPAAGAEEPGQVMVDKDAVPNTQPAEPKAAAKKRPISAPQPDPDEYDGKLEGADAAGQNGQAGEDAEEDAGSYP
jgi:hypothetical protein